MSFLDTRTARIAALTAHGIRAYADKSAGAVVLLGRDADKVIASLARLKRLEARIKKLADKKRGAL